MDKDLDIPESVRAEFEAWQIAVRGNANPQNMTNDVWVWMMKNRISPYKAHILLGTKDHNNPGWTNDRFGQSCTELSDDTKVFIAGEHEDYYDPDFFIYNDVIVESPNGELTLYGYPEADFSPTDFHSATLVDDGIIIIGGIGYAEQRQYDITHVFKLSLSDYSITLFPTTGTAPRWIYKHQAALSEDGSFIIVDGGVTHDEASGESTENLATWKLDLKTGSWAKVSEKQWTRWALFRLDESPNELWKISQLNWAEKTQRFDRFDKVYADNFKERGHTPDLQLYRARHDLPVKHTLLPEDEDDFRTHRMMVGDIVVRYDETRYDIRVTVEGMLEEPIISQLKCHGIETYSAIEGMPYTIKNL